MNRIRIGNDFDVAWSIYRAGVPEDFTTAIDKRLTMKVYGNIIENTLFTITGNIVTANMPAQLLTIPGDYRLIFEYTLPDAGQPDGELKCTTDIVAFRIVPTTAEADSIVLVDVSSDVAIGFKGDEGNPGVDAYQIWLDMGNVGTYEDYLIWQRAPAVDAAASVDALETQVSANEVIRQQNEGGRVDAETLRNSSEQDRITAESARQLSETSRVSAESARQLSETSRVSAESGRVTAESARVTSENSRISAEDLRISAETGRVAAEDGRVLAEQTRITNETTRQQNETLRQTNTANAIANANDATDSANTAASTANTAATNANSAATAANTAAQLADDARLAIQADLALKIEAEVRSENLYNLF